MPQYQKDEEKILNRYNRPKQSNYTKENLYNLKEDDDEQDFIYDVHHKIRKLKDQSVKKESLAHNDDILFEARIQNKLEQNEKERRTNSRENQRNPFDKVDEVIEK